MIAVAHRVPRTAADVHAWTAAGARRFEADVQLADGISSTGTARVVVSHSPCRSWGCAAGCSTTGRTSVGVAGTTRPWPTSSSCCPLTPASLLDPKETHPARRAALVDALAAVAPVRERFVVSTDHGDDLTRYRDAGFTTWRTVKDERTLADVLGGAPLPDRGVSIRHSLLDEGVVARLHEQVPIVVAWTVNDATRARQLISAGVDGITTDRPEIALLVTGGTRPDS